MYLLVSEGEIEPCIEVKTHEWTRVLTEREEREPRVEVVLSAGQRDEEEPGDQQLDALKRTGNTPSHTHTRTHTHTDTHTHTHTHTQNTHTQNTGHRTLR